MGLLPTQLVASSTPINGEEGYSTSLTGTDMDQRNVHGSHQDSSWTRTWSGIFTASILRSLLRPEAAFLGGWGLGGSVTLLAVGHARGSWWDLVLSSAGAIVIIGCRCI